MSFSRSVVVDVVVAAAVVSVATSSTFAEGVGKTASATVLLLAKPLRLVQELILLLVLLLFEVGDDRP